MNATLFIPDISGFTQFVKSTEQAHSKHIIGELLNIIIQKGKKYFTIAEIEGDAVFFYREGLTYPAEDMNNVAKTIHQAFHAHLAHYEHKRICDCGACQTAMDLTLKFVVHAGEISLIDLGQKGKPFGEPVIALHRLLKNGIAEKEYVLYSCAYLEDNSTEVHGSGSIIDADLGEVAYQYRQIEDWRQTPTERMDSAVITPSDVLVKQTRIIACEIAALHALLVNLKYRHYWNKGVEEIIFDPEEINQVGSEHRCIVNGKDLLFDTIKPNDVDATLTYGEILRNPDPFSFFEVDYFLQPAEADTTKLTLVFRVNFKSRLQQLAAPIFRYILKRRANNVLSTIEATVPVFKIKEGLH